MRVHVYIQLLWICIFFNGYGQSKGVAPLHPPDSKPPASTYAVVVGISNYQDPEIPDLRFADRDAEAFANYLRSNAGGNLDNDHLRVLINSKATMAQFANALDWLWEVCKEGDQAIIYFSGHGDVEKKSLTQPGFLLCWDAPARVYMAGGAFALPMLQEVVSTLSIQNKAKVIVITDACRSGTLAGSSVGGAQATASNLAKQFGNEIKIMSCQPNEFSLEGEQWGGGRGAFSFHLIEALYGMADSNNDQWVTLMEIGRYLEDHVSKEVAPISQVPFTVGNRNERLASVDEKVLASIKSGKSEQLILLAAVDSRGMEEDVLSKLDTQTRSKYHLFKTALKNKAFLEPAGACADSYFSELIKEPKLERLHSAMKRNYAAALQDDAQQVINISLKTGLTNLVTKSAIAKDIYRNYPAYLDRAAQLLGEGHYMYSTLKARRHYFEGKMATQNTEKRKAFHNALSWQPDMPHSLSEISTTFSPDQADSTAYYFEKTIALVPNWVVPYLLYSTHLLEKMNLVKESEDLLNTAMKLDSNSIFVWYQKARFYHQLRRDSIAEYWYLKTISGAGNDICFPCAHNQLGLLYRNMGRDEKAMLQFQKAIQLDSSFVNAYLNLKVLYYNMQRFDEAEKILNLMLRRKLSLGMAYYHLGTVYERMGKFSEAEENYKKATKADTTSFLGWYGLGILYCDRFGRYPEAELAFKAVLERDSSSAQHYYNLGNVYLNTERYQEAESLFIKALELDSSFAFAHNNLGMVYTYTNRFEEAELVFKKSIALDPSDFYAYLFLGNLYVDTKRYEEAEGLIRKSIQVNSNYANSWIDLGNLYILWNERYQDAEAAFKTAIQLDSMSYIANYNLGRVYLYASRYPEAETLFSKVIDLDPTVYQGYYMMACLKSLLNDTDEAFAYMTKSLEKGYSNYQEMQKDAHLERLRSQTEKWRALVSLYFDASGNRK